ncbi:hypothetical protein CIHG_08436 [Coccidioides immitis H538.4]|uniref:Uncharacterized protein n=3 Tax=Coccidioides immitis TaxID=5501 RepID=A0A0J8TIE5_COCIT|nr:hypothetical protein CIRG_02707 [Coccidioides immitis RMSCC 2394]KMU73557.1 hypothetical protein CISG_10099 [Coccidioides immitis RMSCC 3703]KMU90625.1 hypothetical protein CIHG_08436 [Coccidioides immitis H538.4]
MLRDCIFESGGLAHYAGSFPVLINILQSSPYFAYANDHQYHEPARQLANDTAFLRVPCTANEMWRQASTQKTFSSSLPWAARQMFGMGCSVKTVAKDENVVTYYDAECWLFHRNLENASF